MKLPKLKYYYYALNSTDYAEFERTRIVMPNSRTTLNPATGVVTETPPFLYFYSSPGVADTRYRQLNHHEHRPVYVLRIPAGLVDRGNLTSAPDPRGMWIYSQPIAVPFCGVERFELDPNSMPVQAQVLASSRRPTMISVPIT